MTASIVSGGRCQVGSVRRCRGLTDIVPYVEQATESAHFLEMDTRNAGSSVRIQHLTGQNQSRFPKLEECAHFHYEHVELGPLQITLYEEEDLKSLSSIECNENSENKWLTVKVTSNGQSWLLRRTYENFRMLDQQLHQCIYDRKFSALPELPPLANLQDKQDPQVYIRKQMSGYCERFSSIAGNLINCGPVLSWLQLDNRGRRLLVTDGDNCPINTPAVAAAYAVKNYTAIASDEISFEIGDMISVIDMPPPEESAWWRGKRGFLVGFFPSNYVAIITDKVPRNLYLNQPTSGTEPTKPVLRKHGKLISFFRAFILSRPSRRTLKQSGILKERVFGCDLGEHLLNTGREIPLVLKCCSEFIELHGIVDGIYRLSGVTSNIQKLRNTFDEERTPALYNDDAIIQDIHSVASLLKMYFRELPNPLCTYQLYKNFVQAVQHNDSQERIKLMRNVVEKLPPPHYRTLECLMRHLSRVAEHGARTGMTARNIAIVWAPNLLRCKELEIGGVAALQGVGVQAVVTEFLITYVDMVFAAKQVRDVTRKSRPKSLSLGTAATRLLSLEEAQSLKLDGEREGYIEVGGGPSCLPEKYHTVIELPSRKRPPLKRSPLGWKSLFSRSGSSSASCSLRKSSPSRFGKRKTSLSSSRIKDAHALDASELRNRLRTVKSAESLTSGGNSARNSSCVEQMLCPISPNASSPKFNGAAGHSRSVSHDSYFDHLDENTPVHANDEGLSELQVNFHMDESEMRIFSEEDTTHLFSIGSSMEQSINKITQPSSEVEDNLVGDSSPKKHKSKDNSSVTYFTVDDSVATDDTSAVCNKRSRLEERLSGNDELAYIDGQANEQLVTEVEVHEQCGSAMTDSTYSTNDTESMQCTDTTGRMAYTPLSEETCTSEIYSNYVDCNISNNRYSYHGDTTEHTVGNKIGMQYDSAPTLVETNNNDDTYEYICTDKSNECPYELLTVVEGKITDPSNDNYEDMIRDWPSKDYFDVSVDSDSEDELMVNNNIYESLVADESSSGGNQPSHYENVSNDVVEGQPLLPITPEYDALPQQIQRPKSLHLVQKSENEVKITPETTDTPQLVGNVYQLLSRFESCTGNETEDVKSNADKKGNDDVVRRERIEKYKEERRMALRQKYNVKDIDDRDEEMIRRFKQKAQRSPQTELKESDKCTSVTTINILYSPTKDPEHCMSRSKDEDKCRYTLSLERRKRSSKQDNLVAKRVTELSEGKDCFMAARRVSSAEFTSPNTEKKERIAYCIKDIAAIFENKDNK